MIAWQCNRRWAASRQELPSTLPPPAPSSPCPPEGSTGGAFLATVGRAGGTSGWKLLRCCSTSWRTSCAPRCISRCTSALASRICRIVRPKVRAIPGRPLLPKNINTTTRMSMSSPPLISKMRRRPIAGRSYRSGRRASGTLVPKTRTALLGAPFAVHLLFVGQAMTGFCGTGSTTLSLCRSTTTALAMKMDE